MPSDKCPRCGTRLMVDTEPDFGFCINHGTVYLKEPLPYVRTLSYKDTGLSPKEKAKLRS